MCRPVPVSATSSPRPQPVRQHDLCGLSPWLPVYAPVLHDGTQDRQGKRENCGNPQNQGNRVPDEEGGKNGRDPVAIKICAALICVDEESLKERRTFNVYVSPESGKDAYPSTTSTPAMSSCRSMSSALLRAKSRQDEMISFHTESSRKPIPLSV